MNDSDLNSDEDYEIDDNELLATLQAENDVDEFLLPANNDSVICDKDSGDKSSANVNKRNSVVLASTGTDADLEGGVTGDDDDDDDDENDPF